MKPDAFKDFVASVRDGGRIHRKELPPARITIRLPGFTPDTVAWLAHLRFSGSYTYGPFPAFNRAARKVGAEDSWTKFVVNYGLEN